MQCTHIFGESDDAILNKQNPLRFRQYMFFTPSKCINALTTIFNINKCGTLCTSTLGHNNARYVYIMYFAL